MDWLLKGLQSQILHCLKMYKIYDKSIHIREEHGNMMSGIDSKRKKLSGGKDSKRHIQGRCSITIMFVIVMMPHNHILRKCTARYKLSGSQEKINNLMSDVESSRWPVCLVHSGNFRRNQITRLPLLSWGNHHYLPCCEFFDPNSGILVSSDRFNWEFCAFYSPRCIMVCACTIR